MDTYPHHNLLYHDFSFHPHAKYIVEINGRNPTAALFHSSQYNSS